MFEVGDRVIIAYEPEAEVHPMSVVANLEGSICTIAEKHKDMYGKVFYYLNPVELKIKRFKWFHESDMRVWWRDDMLKHYKDTQYDIDTMVVFQEG